MSTVLLQYAIQPSEVFVGTTNTLTLTATNPMGGSPITFQGGRDADQFSVSFKKGNGSDDLSNLIDFTCTSLTTGFSCGRNPSTAEYIVSPVGFDSQTLNPGESIQIRFSGVVVNGETGGTKVTIAELIGTHNDSTWVQIQKLTQALNVIPWLDPLVIGKGQVSTLNWISFSGTKVVISGFPTGSGEQTFPVQGQPPFPGSVTVTVPADQAQRAYTATVFTSDNKHVGKTVSLTQNPAVITFFGLAPDGAAPGAPIGAMEEVHLLWGSFFAQQAFLSTPADSQGQRVFPNPSAPTTVTPGFDAYKGALDKSNIPDTASYELTVTGFQTTLPSKVTFHLEQVAVLYFKYRDKDENGNLSVIVWDFAPATWPGFGISFGDTNVLTVNQPGGGSTVRYLGPNDTHPQVQYFNATAGENGKFKLEWVTANLDALTLQPNDFKVPSGDIPSGNVTVTPGQTTTYVLEAKGTDGTSVTSSLTVDVP